MARPADKRKIVKKRMKKFPRFQADRFKRMNQPRWGAQRHRGRRLWFHGEGGGCTPEVLNFGYYASSHIRIHRAAASGTKKADAGASSRRQKASANNGDLWRACARRCSRMSVQGLSLLGFVDALTEFCQYHKPRGRAVKHRQVWCGRGQAGMKSCRGSAASRLVYGTAMAMLRRPVVLEALEAPPIFEDA